MLKWDTSQEGYVVSLQKETLVGALEYVDTGIPDYGEHFTASIDKYYRLSGWDRTCSLMCRSA